MKMIDVLHMPRSIWLGRKTEQNFRPIAFDVYKWLTDYPEATVSGEGKIELHLVGG